MMKPYTVCFPIEGQLKPHDEIESRLKVKLMNGTEQRKRSKKKTIFINEVIFNIEVKTIGNIGCMPDSCMISPHIV